MHGLFYPPFNGGHIFIYTLCLLMAATLFYIPETIASHGDIPPTTPDTAQKEEGCPLTFYTAFSIIALGLANIIRPAAVCKTLVTTTSMVSPINLLPPSTTIMVPSSKYATP